MAAEQRLAPHATTRGQRRRQDHVHLPRRGPRGAGCVIGPPDLAKDFGFAQDLRIEPSSDEEQMADRIPTIVPQELGIRGYAPAVGKATKPGLEVYVTAPVELAAVASRKQDSGSAGLVLALKQGNGFGRGERESLALLHCGHMVADANDME
jgi:hypothetical protein